MCVVLPCALGSCGVRFNPGLGSGGTEKTNVGGPAASFGIWHTEKASVQAIAARHQITIKRIHTHIGSGSEPSVWINAASLSLALVDFFPTVTVLNLGMTADLTDLSIWLSAESCLFSDTDETESG